MLMWHRLADAAILASSSVAYYEGVEKLMGGGPQPRTSSGCSLFLECIIAAAALD